MKNFLIISQQLPNFLSGGRGGSIVVGHFRGMGPTIGGYLLCAYRDNFSSAPDFFLFKMLQLKLMQLGYKDIAAALFTTGCPLSPVTHHSSTPLDAS